MRALERALVITGTLTLGLVVVVGVEILLARLGDRLDPFPRESLDGRIGGSGDTPLRIVWIGDSTGDGVGASTPDATLPRTFARGLDRPVDLRVLARSGARTLDAIQTQLPELAGLRPDWVVVGIGSNDVIHLTSLSDFRAQLDRLLQGVLATEPDSVIVVGPGQFASTPRFAQPLRFIAGRRARALNRDARQVAQAHGAVFVDIIERVGRFFVDDPARYHARDDFHPSDAGYGLWARAALDAVAGRPS